MSQLLTCIKFGTQVIYVFGSNDEVELEIVTPLSSWTLNTFVKLFTVPLVLYFTWLVVVAEVISCVNPIFGNMGLQYVIWYLPLKTIFVLR